MVRKFSFLAILALGGILSACATGTVADLNNRDWIGRRQEELVRAWGTPHHDYPMPDGGRAIGYLFVNQAVTGPKQQVLFRATNCMVNFTVGRDGVIDDATTTGKNCRIGRHDQMHPKTN
ncbi:MAG: hypothetical protein K2Y40_00260 [Reyranella sp.]|nr:hypothetical protein [Reyranella sp.]